MKPYPGRTLFLVAVLAAVLWLGYATRAVVTPLLAALLLAYVLDPVVRALQRLGASRSVASALVVVLAFAMVAGAAFLTTTRLVQEASNFYDDVVGEPARYAETGEEAMKKLAGVVPPETEARDLRKTTWEEKTLWYLDQDGDGAYRPGIAREGFARLRRELAATTWARDLTSHLDPTEKIGNIVASSAGQWLKTTADAGQSAAQTLLAVLTLVVLFPIYLYYSLVRLSWVYDVTVKHLPAGHRAQVVEILGKIHHTLAAFFRGRLILLVIRWAVLTGLFAAFQVPFAGVCAAFGAVASLVPVLGPIVGAAVPLLLLFSTSPSAATTLGLVGSLVTLEVVDQYVLTPAIIGKRVGLHPLTILVATFVAGDLLGIFGMLVAIPLTAVLKILAIEFVVPEVRKQAGLSPVAGVPPVENADAPPAETTSGPPL